MTDLTEQWKKGELPSGYYYIIPIGYNNHSYIDFYNAETDDWEVNYCNKIQTVLDQVPTYNGFEALKSDFKYMKKLKKDSEEDNESYRQKINQLKELLKKCDKYLYEQDLNYDLIAEIEEALK